MFMLTLRFRFVQVRPPVQRSTGPRVRDKSSAAAILIASDVSAGRSGAGNDSSHWVFDLVSWNLPNTRSTEISKALRDVLVSVLSARNESDARGVSRFRFIRGPGRVYRGLLARHVCLFDIIFPADSVRRFGFVCFLCFRWAVLEQKLLITRVWFGCVPRGGWTTPCEWWLWWHASPLALSWLFLRW
jgi:hypothetical protein